MQYSTSDYRVRVRLRKRERGSDYTYVHDLAINFGNNTINDLGRCDGTKKSITSSLYRTHVLDPLKSIIGLYRASANGPLTAEGLVTYYKTLGRAKDRIGATFTLEVPTN